MGQKLKKQQLQKNTSGNIWQTCWHPQQFCHVFIYFIGILCDCSQQRTKLRRGRTITHGFQNSSVQNVNC